jgi:hypothetical protein
MRSPGMITGMPGGYGVICSAQDRPRAGRRSAGFRLVLVALPVLALAAVPFRGVDGTVDLLIVLMVGVALGEPRYFVDLLAGLLRVLLGVGLRLLLQVVGLPFPR